MVYFMDRSATLKLSVLSSTAAWVAMESYTRSRATSPYSSLLLLPSSVNSSLSEILRKSLVGLRSFFIFATWERNDNHWKQGIPCRTWGHSTTCYGLRYILSSPLMPQIHSREEILQYGRSSIFLHACRWPARDRLGPLFYARARVYTKSFLFFSVTSVTGLRNQGECSLQLCSTFSGKWGTFSRKCRTFSGKYGRFSRKCRTSSGKCRTFSGKYGTFRGNEQILWGKKLIFGEEMASVIVVWQ